MGYPWTERGGEVTHSALGRTCYVAGGIPLVIMQDIQVQMSTSAIDPSSYLQYAHGYQKLNCKGPYTLREGDHEHVHSLLRSNFTQCKETLIVLTHSHFTQCKWTLTVLTHA